MSGVFAQTSDQLAPLEIPNVEYSAIMPALILIGAALLLLTASSMVRRRPRPGLSAAFSVLASVGALIAAQRLWDRISDDGPFTAIAGAVVVDGYSVFFMVLLAVAVGLGALIAEPYLRRERLDFNEFHVLMLLSASGAMFMAAANDLIMLFLGLEILSIALYVMAGYHARRRESGEAAMKYFLLGAFSSAIFLYGIALVYGATGTTNLPGIATYLSGNVVQSGGGVLFAGMALMLVGLGFKVAAVPFHTWTPDVYQGSPTPATAFMAAAAKAGGFAGLLRVFISAFSTLRLDWRPAVFVLAVVTILVGSVLAIVQTDVKRMLAYSSISHAGYVLIGLEAGTRKGVSASLFYLLAYAFMVLGSFAIVTLVGRRGDARHALDDYRGLSATRPALALAFTVFLMAQAGVPFTSGFLAKFYVIAAAVDSRSYVLAVVAMLAAAIAAFFYLRLILVMYSPRAEGDERPRIAVPAATGVAVVVAAAFTIVVGLLPGPVSDFARHATLLF